MEINVLIEEGLEISLDAEWLQNIVEKSLLAEDAPSNAEITLVITGQERMQQLNREYRGKDRPTDVLSFSMSESRDQEDDGFISPPDGIIHLGEIVISYPQAALQAEERSHSIREEVAVLIIHGVLHILGYDHEKLEMEPAMTAREKEILAQIQENLL
jgi:probable rRNA maturation factor